MAWSFTPSEVVQDVRFRPELARAFSKTVSGEGRVGEEPLQEELSQHGSNELEAHGVH